MMRTSGKATPQLVFMINTGGARKPPSAVRDFSHLKDVSIPGDKLESIKTRTSTAMKSVLQPKIRRAIAFLRRKREGNQKNQDIKQLAAETAPATITIVMYTALRKAFTTATKRNDAASLANVYAAVLVLSNCFSEGMVSDTTYPPDTTLKKRMLDAKKSAAKEIWRDVTEAIGDVPQKLGVVFPRCPD